MEKLEGSKEIGFVKNYLKFIDTNVLFKKPVSCLYAISSLLIPVFFLIQIIQFKVFESEIPSLIVVSIFLLLIFIFAGFFGSLIWYYRRIIQNEGPKWYPNFRRFIQTLGEWTATLVAIIGFFTGIIIIIMSNTGDFRIILSFMPLMVRSFGLMLAPYSLVVGFLIIIATKIILYLLDPVIWLIKQLWSLLVRVVLYFYRITLKVFGIFEENAPLWFGVNWLLAILVVAAGLWMGCKLLTSPSWPLAFATILSVGLGLSYTGFMILRKKKDNY